MRTNEKKRRSRLTGLILAAALLVQVFRLPAALAAEYTEISRSDAGSSPAAGAGAQTEEAGDPDSSSDLILIRNEEDFLLLAEKSADERETAGKVFRLERDLDFTGRDFVPLGLFSGVFDGGNHVIRGISRGKRSSCCGVFRIVGRTGVVKRLRAEGTLICGENGEEIGGIAGRNEGRIEECRFSGALDAAERAGGIVGMNRETGTILACVNYAGVTGKRRIGGIAGHSRGQILDCVNEGPVNEERKPGERDRTEDREEKGMESLDPDSWNLTEAFPGGSLTEMTGDLSGENDRIAAIGGIAGENEGLLTGCRNSGAVGSLHTDYEVGGITGYERGTVSGNENLGTVMGRKNVGGIAGLFEPYAETAYVRDAYDDARDQLDQLVELVTALHGTAGDEDVRIRVAADAIRGNVDLLRETIRRNKEYYRLKDDGLDQEIRGWMDAIRGKAEELEIRDSDRSVNAMEALKSDTDSALHMIGAAEEAARAGIAVDMVNYIGRFTGLLEDVLAQTDVLLEDAGKKGKEAKRGREDLEELRGMTGDCLDYLKGRADEYKGDLRRTEEEIRVRIDEVRNGMDFLADSLKESDSALRQRVTDITEQMKTLDHTLNRADEEVNRDLDDLRAHLSDLQESELFDDRSDSAPEEAGRGVLSLCTNRGKVRSDFNAGGIAGTAAVMDGSLSDFQIVSVGQVSLKTTRTRLSLIRNCWNYGEVEAKRSCAGGILGQAEMGAVVSCGSFAGITVPEGACAGGIAGKSGGTIRSCQAMGVITAKNRAGGIAGQGRRLFDNLCCVSLTEGPRHGAVAGDVDREGSLSGNLFVPCGIGAVNGATREEEAEPVSYETLTGLPGISEEFRFMRVTFRSGGETVRTVRVPYGGRLKESEWPDPPGGDGDLVYWDKTDLREIRQDVTVEAVHGSYLTTAASGEERPVLLVSGNFLPGTSVSWQALSLSGGSLASPAPEQFRVLGAYEWGLKLPPGFPGQKVREQPGYTLRLLMEDAAGPGTEGTITAAVPGEGGALRILDSRRDGSYLVFRMPDEGVFCLLERKKGGPFRYAAAGALAAVLLILRLTKRNRSGRKGSC